MLALSSVTLDPRKQDMSVVLNSELYTYTLDITKPRVLSLRS